MTPPALVGVYLRKRLFQLLERACNRPVVWLSAPGGAGKTTLAASYLKERKRRHIWYKVDAADNDAGSFFYHMRTAVRAAAPRQRKPMPLLAAEISGISTFAATYFRELFARLKPPAVLVFDDYQALASDAALHEALCSGFEQTPAGFNIIVLSREEPPPAMVRLRATNRVEVLGWNELKLAESESIAIATLRRRRAPLSRAFLRDLHEKTQGWVAGVVLLTERAESLLEESAHPQREFATQTIFDYFANEVLRYERADVQAFLLKTAFLPRISPPIAAMLTGTSSTDLLADLTRRNYFTVRHNDGSYEYHPLFKAFLFSRANAAFSAEELSEIKRQCARLLSENGDAEAAIALLQQAEAWEDALRLIVRVAPTMVAQGRTATVEGWLVAVPPSVRDNDPWALYWLGVCRFRFTPQAGRAYFEKAFELFERQAESTPLYLAWSKIVESYLFEMKDYRPLGPWLDRYPSLSKGRTLPAEAVANASLFTYVAALTHARTDHPDLPVCAARAEGLFATADYRQQLERAAALIPYYVWKGDVTRFAKLVERVTASEASSGTSDLAQVNGYIWKSLYAAEMCRAEEALRAVTAGLAFAEATGVHLADYQLLSNGIYSQVCVGDVGTARELLRRMSLLPLHGPVYGTLYSQRASMVALLEGDTVRAVDEAKRGVEFAQASGLYLGAVSALLVLACAYLRQGDTEAAQAVLAEAGPKCVAMKSERFMSYCALCEASIHQRRGDVDAARTALKRSLALARAGGVITIASTLRDDAPALFAMALDAGIEPDFVKTIIAKTRLAPPRDSMPGNWPWQARIYTLGKFAVIRDGQPLMFNERSRKKPRELLRQLIALGGTDVSVSLLLQALWPDAEGDMAKFSFKTTLYRLRHLIGEHAVLFEDGRLSLNADCCWVDTWALDRALAQPVTELTREHGRSLFSLYQGAFLPHDDTPFVLLQRERLRSKFLRGITEVARALHTQPEEAIAWYQRGIEIDPLAENLYRELMRCFQRLNRPAEALTTYERCRAALKAALQVEPSAETRTLASQLRDATN